MKKSIFSLALICLAMYVFAQEKTYTIKKDTINLRGYVYDSKGLPAVYQLINSSQYHLFHNEVNSAVNTDETGFFEFKGTGVNDTLTVFETPFHKSLTYYNKGSRYMVIYLPVPQVINTTPEEPVMVNALRVYPKRTPALKITKQNQLSLNCGVSIMMARYPGGNERLAQYVKPRLSYPINAIMNNIEGYVKIGFTVERDGTLINYKILQGIGYGCDQDVIRVLKASPKWQPAISNNRPAQTEASISVQYKLTDKTDK